MIASLRVYLIKLLAGRSSIVINADIVNGVVTFRGSHPVMENCCVSTVTLGASK